MNASTLVQKLWNCCNIVRDDGLSHGDYALEDSANLPAPDIIAREIGDDLEAAPEQFREITDELEEKTATSK